MGDAFRPDPDLAAKVQTYATMAVDFASRRFEAVLDYRPDSIEAVEQLIAELHHLGASDDDTFQLGVVFGSYLGEVLRRSHGAEWGLITSTDGAPMPGIRLDTGPLLRPWDQVQRRIVEGDGANLWTYYLAATST